MCVICRKLASKLNKLFQEVEIRMKTDQVKAVVIGMEKEIESGMEKAKNERTYEMTKELKEIEEKRRAATS